MARIVIADDALFMRASIKKILTEGGHEVVAEAGNGQQAVTAYSSNKPDLVLMDITMPEMDGLAALHEIMSADDAARVVMCSALGQENKVREALELGAKDFVVKPFQPAKLLDAVRRALP
ncbi:MAG TPA: response regulator [Armatimonadota bacterium]|jgi:two-component system chemotaxis response regulator CheY